MKRLLRVCAAGAVLALVAGGCPQPDTTAPTVLSTIPADGAVNVSRSAGVTVTFSEAMDTAATRAAFQLAPAVTGSIGWTGDDVLSFTPAADLDSNTTYTVTISTAACDRAGNALASAYVTTFKTGTAVTSGIVYMMGRSVLYGWFIHWGWQYDDAVPYVHGRFQLYHRFIEGPDIGVPAMLDTVRTIVAGMPAAQNPTVFFKLCFVDFYGGSQEEADSNFARNRTVIDSVYNMVVGEYGYSLILGNALPRTAGETDSYLVANHAQYNQYLLNLETQHPGEVFVFDFYDVLVDPATHGIRHSYATANDDAHPNNAGYNALDASFFPFLEGNF